MNPFTAITNHDPIGGSCQLSPHKLNVYQIDHFSNLCNKDKSWLVVFCDGQHMKTCAINSMDAIHQMFLLAEDALVKASARLVLIAKPPNASPGSILHVFRVEQLEVSRGTTLTRKPAQWAIFWSSAHTYEFTLRPGSILLSFQRPRCWSEFKVVWQSTLNEVIEKMFVEKGIGIVECPPEIVMHVYYLQCFCKDQGPHLAHGRISLDHVYVELCTHKNITDKETIVVMTEKACAIIKGKFKSIDKLYPLQNASDLAEDRLQWFRSEIEFIQWFDFEDRGAGVSRTPVKPPVKPPIMPCSVLDADLERGGLFVHTWSG
ncbi:hypothetical protein KCU78_g3369, partial [Aureobasidium melanogenum]